jgi:hypothetical protein
MARKLARPDSDRITSVMEPRPRKMATRGVRMAAVLVLALSSLLSNTVAQPVLRYEGRVQWIAGSTMALALDDGGSVRLDLTRVPQDQHLTLQPGTRIIVRGVISEDASYVAAISIEPSKSRGIEPR